MNAIQNYHSMGTIPRPIQKHYSLTTSIGRRSKSCCNATRTTEFSVNHRSSLEASSAVSSGYWEDYESLGQSASGSANLACVTRYETANTATAVRQQPTGLSVEHMPSEANSAYLSEHLDSMASNECPSGWRQLKFERTNGLQEGSAASRPYKVLDETFGPIPKSLSSDMASTYVRSLEDITEASDCQPHSAGNPTTNTTPVKTGQLGYADIRIPVMHSSALSFDELSSDSDDELDGADQNSAPKTQFEAALRRAHLAQKQRKTTSMGLPARRAMPDWGSPIQWSRVQRPESLGQPQVPEELNFHSTSPPPSLGDFSSPSHELAEPESPILHNGRDFCTGMEIWLNNRTHWIYKTHKTNTQAFQLCFQNSFDQEIDNPMSIKDPAVEQQTTSLQNDAQPRQFFEYGVDAADSQLTIRAPELHLMDQVVTSTHLTQHSPLRGRNASEGVTDRLDELDRFCRLYLEQTLQDCQNEDIRMLVMNRLEGQKRLHSKTHLALSQLPKIARMQLEVEQYQWCVVSPTVSGLLPGKIKPRSLLNASMLLRCTTSQLKLISNDLHEVIGDLSRMLVDELTQRDELHLEQGARCIELDDLAAYFKDLCIRASIRQFRRKISAGNPDPTRSSMPTCLPTHYLHIPELNGGKSVDPMFTTLVEVKDRRSSISQRLISTLFGRRTTR
ncbi:hypothetical protein CSKR_109377 [Clonorchis sinensis]|uniref:Schwannomin interacting protein 1 C-terminal domain-containing protein n=1 Tax=Clonorchis sinensis TaxID=79923 RepID=A0A3R7ERK4_CLOSI|nr:hypothetical protein CSKR_109377 [Clonorchis sinensis]